MENQESRKKKPRKPLSEENKPGRYDPRNQLNDLTGKDWLLLTKSYWETETCNEDKTAYAHPAPFMIKDVGKLISLFTKQGMTVLDPFVGSGTTLISCQQMNRRGVGIDINPDYEVLYRNRLREMNMTESTDQVFIVADALKALDAISDVDYIVTSPPYFNILKNKSKGIRHDRGKQYRMAAREGVEYYSEDEADLGNAVDYQSFLEQLKTIMSKCYIALASKKYATIIMSDFTVDKREVCVQGDIVRMMQDIGFEFCGTTILLQPVKPLFPFGYPYAYKINHDHQNIMTFRKTPVN